MPSVAQEEPILHPSKKRRRDDGGDSSTINGSVQLYENLGLLKSGALANNLSFSPRHATLSRDHFLLERDDEGSFTLHNNDNNNTSSSHHHHLEITHAHLAANPLLAKKIFSLPSTKRIRTDNESSEVSSRSIAPGFRGDQRRIAVPHHRQPKHHPSTTTATQDALQQTSANFRLSSAAKTNHSSSSALAPCHICVRRPTKKSDLDSFADCEGCGQRTCYVCMRECLGWWFDAADHDTTSAVAAPSTAEDDYDLPYLSQGTPGGALLGVEGGSTKHTSVEDEGSELPVCVRGRGGHRQMICSRCCVEQGPEGDVMCLGCLQRR